MFLRDLRPQLFSRLYSGTYECVECDVEVRRDFKDGRNEAPLAPAA
jgi:hypothetical protein